MEPSFREDPNRWITWYKDTHKCSLVEAIDAIMRKRETKPLRCLDCHMAHFGKFNEYTWRCGETGEVLLNVAKLDKSCPVYSKECSIK